jgi:hypothetical protein
MSQATGIANKDTLSLPASQVREIYLGLKQGEQLKVKLKQSNAIALELNSLLQQSNDSLQKSSEIIYDLDYQIYELQNTLIDNAPVPWYKKWWVWGLAGVLTGRLIK